MAWRIVNGWTIDRVQEVAEATRLAGRAADLGKDDAIALSFGGIARGAAAAFDKLLAREPEKGNFIIDTD